MRFLLSWLVCFSMAVAADTAKWQQYKTTGTTSVEYRHNAEKLLEVRAQTEANSTTAAFLQLLDDTANIRSWAANTEKAELLSQPDANTDIVHTYFTAIWPVSQRDMVTKSVWREDNSTGVLTMVITDMGQHFPAVQGYIRMQQVQGVWTLTPLGARRLKIQYQGQANPAGKLPHFIADKVALKSVLKTFQQLQQVLPNYQRP